MGAFDLDEINCLSLTTAGKVISHLALTQKVLVKHRSKTLSLKAQEIL